MLNYLDTTRVASVSFCFSMHTPPAMATSSSLSGWTSEGSMCTSTRVLWFTGTHGGTMRAIPGRRSITTCTRSVVENCSNNTRTMGLLKNYRWKWGHTDPPKSSAGMGQAQSTGPQQLHNRFLKSIHKVIQQAGRYRSSLRFTHQSCSSKFGSPNNQLGSMESLRSMILSSQEMAMRFASVWFQPIWLLSSFQACCHSKGVFENFQVCLLLHKATVVTI